MPIFQWRRHPSQMRLQIAFLSLIAFPCILLAQATAGNREGVAPSSDTLDIQGHHLGELVARFLRLELDAREDVDVCRHNPSRSLCKSLLDAIDNDARTEVS